MSGSVLARDPSTRPLEVLQVFFEHLGYKRSPIVNNWPKDFWAANDVKI